MNAIDGSAEMRHTPDGTPSRAIRGGRPIYLRETSFLVGAKTRSAIFMLTMLSLGACQDQIVNEPSESCALHKVAEVPVDLRGNVPLVPVVINGRPAKLVLDTGARFTVLREDKLAELGIRFEFAKRATLQGVGNAVTAVTAKVDRLQLGDLALHGTAMAIADYSFPVENSAAGLLGTDILSRYDVDLDLPHSRITLYHLGLCGSGSPPWQRQYLTIAAQRINDRLAFPIVLDHQTLVAMIDTGASPAVTIDRHAALRLGISEQSLANDRVVTTKGVGANKLLTHVHQFSELAISRDVIQHPNLPIVSLPSSSPEALVGVGYLKHRRIWLDYGTSQIFVM